MALALCIGAAEKESPKTDWSRIKVLTYPSSTTGLFDPDTGRLYLYDMNLEQCYAIRELTKLGEPMKRLRN